MEANSLLNFVGRSAVLLSLLVSVSARPVAAATACVAPQDPRQAQLDQAGLATAQAGGLPLRVVRQCAGFSVVVQDSIDPALADEYATQAEQAYAHLASETGSTLSPRAVLFIFEDQTSMASGEQVLAGIVRPTLEPRAGYAWMNTIWLDSSRHRTGSARAEAVAHEFSHLFAAVTAKGKTIPSWFDEGLAVDSEITLSAESFPSASLARASEERTAVLEAANGDGPIDLFALDALATNRLWQQHYVDPDEQYLEYAQAYQTVRAAMGTRGRAAAWNVLREMGTHGLDFQAAFQIGFGRTVDEVDAAARAGWDAELAAPPEPLALSVHIASSADASDVQIDVHAEIDNLSLWATADVAPGTTLAFEIRPDGTLVQPASDLTIDTTVLADEDVYGSFVAVRIHHPDGTIENVSLERSYGRWEQVAQRMLDDPNSDQRFAFVDGPLSDPFPSGDTILRATPPAHA